MSMKVLTESLEKAPIKEKSYVVTTAREINEKMLASYNKMKTIREQVEEVKSQWKALQEDIEGVTFARFIHNGTLQEQFQKTLDQLKLEYEDAKTTYLHYKELGNKVLTESEDNDTLEYDYEEDRPVAIQPDSSEGVEDGQEDAAVTDTDNLISELTSYVDANNVEELLDYMFETFVPEIGVADTLVGELTRALMNILYVYKLSGKVFYQDSGLSQCGGSAQFLMDNGYESDITEIMTSDMDDYYTAVIELTTKIARDAITSDIITKHNHTDSDAYTNQRIVSSAPRFTYTIYMPYKVIEGIDYDQIDYNDAVEFVKDVSGEADVEYIDPYNDKTAIEAINITKPQFDTLEKVFGDMSVWDKFEVASVDVSDERNIETDDIFNVDEDDLEESVEATNIALTEEFDARLAEFLALHDDEDNYNSHKSGYAQLYSLFDSYGFHSDYPVDVAFKGLSDYDKDIALALVGKR